MNTTLELDPTGSQLIPTIEHSADGTPVISSEVLAEGTENQHKNVLQLIRTYRDDLEEFGRVESQTRPFETSGGTQWREVFYLTEPQATLILTYMRNMERIRIFKKALVKAFYELARPVALSGPELLAHAVLEAQSMIAAKDAEIAELEPKAAAWETLVNAVGDYSLRDAAQILSRDGGLSIGQNRLGREMRRLGMIDKQGIPYQRHVDRGRLSSKPRTYKHPRTGETMTASPQVRIHGKGLDYIYRALTGNPKLEVVK